MSDLFCGWYLKLQNGEKTVALIPAYHISDGEKSCSIQVITERGAWNVVFDAGSYHQGRDSVQIGNNRFSREGIWLDLHGSGIDAVGQLTFGSFAPIRYDIMGPFRYVPFMQCRHSVISMRHSAVGQLNINGEPALFAKGLCYIEGDRGRSFPREYMWTHCFYSEGSIMLSVADIPFCGIHFTGIIGVIHHCGKEYRLCTYLGARAERISHGEVQIRQGRQCLTVQQLENRGFPLAAPAAGSMCRTIREAAATRAFYQYQIDGKTLFAFESDQASLEYEYHQ